MRVAASAAPAAGVSWIRGFGSVWGGSRLPPLLRGPGMAGWPDACQRARAGQCSGHPIRQDAIMASKTSWAAFPHDAKAYAFAGDALKKAWPKLHAGDCEPFPDDKRAAALLKAAGKAAPKLDASALAAALQDAWRAFHRGDFKAAFDAGSAL